ncbi:hypothetical protein PHYPSEUDO_004368 [Phytophthora pseudosyringae]|uniref:Uncharacterized protein n=1 Tax=Phytophthora pseudosyringae TaxID=221518 RepID=A0A8T1VN55_9STRA|nr:hypothetical protein PHYPSEUDO_004368 [Phytophthora pseudosyringae]
MNSLSFCHRTYQPHGIVALEESKSRLATDILSWTIEHLLHLLDFVALALNCRSHVQHSFVEDGRLQQRAGTVLGDAEMLFVGHTKVVQRRVYGDLPLNFSGPIRQACITPLIVELDDGSKKVHGQRHFVVPVAR